jgi:Arc/MetJ family transcription regulator
MRTTITLDDDLMEEAMKYSGITEKSKLVAHALSELIRHEVTERFLALEGTMPDLEYVQRGYRSGREPLPKSVLNDSDE